MVVAVVMMCQDAVGSLIVLICGLIVVYSVWPNAGMADAVGGLIV